MGELCESALRKRVVGGSNPSAGIGEAIDPVTNTPVVSRAQGARACLHSIA
jgi:hypothetical protein